MLAKNRAKWYPRRNERRSINQRRRKIQIAEKRLTPKPKMELFRKDEPIERKGRKHKNIAPE